MKKVWIVTGVSGSGRKEFIDEIASSFSDSIVAFDVGSMMLNIANEQALNITNEKILDCDFNTLKLLRVMALQEIHDTINKSSDNCIFLIGIHAVFPWRGRLIPGISIDDILKLNPIGVINVVDDVSAIYKINSVNPKWKKNDKLTIQQWMMEEEYVSSLFAEFLHCSFYVVAKTHNVNNIVKLLKTEHAKCIYLSYPITAIKEEKPDFYLEITNDIIPRLSKMFVVFNPLDIKDLMNTGIKDEEVISEKKNNKLKKERTVSRDYAFIDQSDAVIVIYNTKLHSPGVASEIEYAHRNSKRVYIFYPNKPSPFLENAVDYLYSDMDSLWGELESFSKATEAAD